MPRHREPYAKKNAGLRLTLLVGLATALFLLPAAAASAATATVVIDGSGSGELIPEPGFEPLAGSPPIECKWNGEEIVEIEPGVPSTCSTTANEEGGFTNLRVLAVPAAGSQIVKWEILSPVTNKFPGLCKDPEEPGGSASEPCGGFSLVAGDVEIKAVFEAVGSPEEFPLVIEVEGDGGVTGTGIACTEDENGEPACEEEFEAGEEPGLEATPETGRVFTGWETVEGNAGSCEGTTSPCNAGPLAEPTKLKATFEEPNVHIEIEGEGSGSVIGEGFGTSAGIPPIECDWNGETEEQTGVCDVVMGEALGNEAVKVIHEAAPGSEFAGWKTEGGLFNESSCAPLSAFCSGLGIGGTVTIKAKFDLFVPSFPLNLTTSGGGSGSLACKIGAGSFGVCPAEVKEGESVEVKVTPAVGSELTEWTTGPCEGTTENPCSFEMPSEEVSANAELNVETFTLTLNPPIGEGTLEADCGGACPAEIPYGTEVTVTATPAALNSVGTLTGAGSASVCSNEAGPEEAATCEFEIKADSEVTAEFVTAASIATDPGNVFGEVDQQTTLETENCDNVDVGKFVPSNAQEVHTNDECVVTVTATGTENELRAADEEVIVPNGTNETGHLTQEPGDPFTLNNPLQVRGTGTTGGAAPSGYMPLSSTALLQDYGTPVSLDVVTVEFRQVIDAFEPLHTGTYDKVITLTLEQNVL